MLSNFTREKKIVVGSAYMETDIFNRDADQEQYAHRGTRSKKHNESRPAQANLNSKNARRYLRQLINGNFVDGDLWVTLTYTDAQLPKTVEEGEKHVRNFLRRIARRRKRDGLDSLKYVLVSEYPIHKDGSMGRIHHHIVMNSMDRDAVENLWKENRRKLGMTNTRVLDSKGLETDNGFEGLAEYLVKNPAGKKRWSSSRNLKRPVSRTNDWRFRRRKIAELAEDKAAAYMFFSKKYPDWDISGIEFSYNELSGWAVYLKMWRKPERGKAS